MSALAHPSALSGRGNGGVAARRALIRWAGRMFRREWRQQLLVVTLLTVAVAAAIASVTLVHNASLAVNSEFGSANTVLEFDGTDPQKLAAGLAAVEQRYGTMDVIGHRSVVVPGSVDKVDYRAQDPHGAYGRGLLALRRGRYPERRGEVAAPTGSRDCSGSSSDRPSRSTAFGGPSSASSRTHASSATSSLSSPPRSPAHPTTSRCW
jgi:putative ABC transport system permease protein